MSDAKQIDANGQRREWPGETRRQALARCAMQGMLAGNPEGDPDAVAEWSYQHADSMLAFEAKERAEREGAK